MTKKVFFKFWLVLTLGFATMVFNSCTNNDLIDKEVDLNSTVGFRTNDEGVEINGVKWATSNVALPGMFAAKPEDVGRFYQWNRKVAKEASGNVTDWDPSAPVGDEWEWFNDPSPAGWRVPTLDEIKSLFDTENVNMVLTTENEVKGIRFIDIATGASIFLPAAGCRSGSDGKLYDAGLFGFYWSNTAYNDANDDFAYSLLFGGRDVVCEGSNRRLGRLIRSVALPVIEEPEIPEIPEEPEVPEIIP